MIYSVHENHLRRCIKMDKAIASGFGGSVSTSHGHHYHDSDGESWFTVDGSPMKKKLVLVRQKGRSYKRCIIATANLQDITTKHAYLWFSDIIETFKPVPWKWSAKDIQNAYSPF